MKRGIPKSSEAPSALLRKEKAGKEYWTHRPPRHIERPKGLLPRPTRRHGSVGYGACCRCRDKKFQLALVVFVVLGYVKGYPT